MQAVNDCFKKVKKDCFKFISSQETKKDKFKNKDKMIKSFLIPVSFWIAKKVNKKKHPLLMTRGVPGTHDVDLMLNFFKQIKDKNFKSLQIPTFNKAIDDRCQKSLWYKIKTKPDVVIFGGWCVGARAQSSRQLKKPINSLEKVYDQGTKWRTHVNNQLKTKYKTLFKQLDGLLYLKAKNFSLLRKWRLKQERKLWIQTKNKKNLKIMSSGDVINFMQTYQRITQQMFKDAIKSSSIIMNLNSNHQIEKIKFKK